MGLIQSLFGKKEEVLEIKVYNMLRSLLKHLEEIIEDHNINNKTLEDFQLLINKVREHNNTLDGIIKILNGDLSVNIVYANKEIISNLKETRLQQTPVLYKPSEKIFTKTNKELNLKKAKLEITINTITSILSSKKAA